MAIEIREPEISKPSAVKEFTDRVDSFKDFRTRRDIMLTKGSTIITFYGAGGVGKSTLLEKLEDEAGQCKCIKYNFSYSTDLHEILRRFKYQLAAYGCSFPLFDTGNYYYSLKVGQYAEPIKAISILEQIPWIKEFRKKLSKSIKFMGDSMPVFQTNQKVLNALTDEGENLIERFLSSALGVLYSAMPATRALTSLMSLGDTLLVKYLAKKGVLDETHKAVRNKLNDLRQKKDPVELGEYLPTLFAMDVKDWMKETGNKLIVFLDNYELLIGATNLPTAEQRKRDLWLRGYNGLIRMIPDTLWTIAGRNEICWDCDLAKENEQHLIKAFSREDSDWFLRRAGVEDETLRGELVKLTEGYPIFLDLCVDFYIEYKWQHGKAPTIDEFGKTREDVVRRIFRYLDNDRDDAAKDVLEFLCVLNMWTDEIVIETGSVVLPNFSRNTYKRVKNFSFIHSEQLTSDDFALTIYRFDKTIQSILIATCDEDLIVNVKTAVDEYFKSFFAGKEIFDAREIFYLKLWSEFVVRFANDANELLRRYKEIFGDKVSTLTDCAYFNAAEEILKPFINKFENLRLTDKIEYVYFEMDLWWLRRSQGDYKRAFNIIKSAYGKCCQLLGNEHIETVRAMHKLAISLNDLGFYNKALDFRERVFTLRKKILGNTHSDTLDAMHNLAVTLNDLGRYNQAFRWNEQVFTLRKKILGNNHPDTLDAMINLANSLRGLGRYEKALTMQKRILEFSKRIHVNRAESIIAAMHNLAVTLNDMQRRDEALTMQRQVFRLSKKILGYENPETIAAMHNLAIYLNNCSHHGTAVILREQVLNLSKKILGEEHPNTLNAMNNLAISLINSNHYPEALELQEQVLQLSKKILGEEHPNTLDAICNLAETLRNSNHYPEAIVLQRGGLAQCEKIFGDDNPLTIAFIENLAESLLGNDEREEAGQLIERAVTAAQKTFGSDHLETKKILELREKFFGIHCQ